MSSKADGSKAGQASAASKKKDKLQGGPDNLTPGTKVLAQYRDGKWRDARVIDRVEVTDEDGKATGSMKYYVHYIEYNRRMDEWLPQKRVKWNPDQSDDDLHASHKPVEKPPTEAEAADQADGVPPGMRRTGEGVYEFVDKEHDEHEGMDEAAIRDHEEVTKVKNINRIHLGRHVIEAWYFTPYPQEFWKGGVTDTLYLDEFTLKFFLTKEELVAFRRKCTLMHPPGDELYRHDGIAMFEVDGAVQKEYCQNLSYVAKMFLDHKTLYYDVDPFLFYIMCEVDEFGYHIVGYYSKEKYSEAGYNLACILTLPPYQRKGYGKFLIQFSYALSKIEKRVGSPEKPLSDLGLLSYRSYWSWVLLNYLHESPVSELSIVDMARDTSIKAEDILFTLQYLGIIKYVNQQYVLVATPQICDAKREKLNNKVGPICDESKVHFTPFPETVRKDKWALSSKLKGRAAADAAAAAEEATGPAAGSGAIFNPRRG